MTKLRGLEIEVAKQTARADTWEQAFKLMSYHGVPVNEETLKRVRQKKTTAEGFEEGQKLAELMLLPNKEQFPAKGAVGVQNAWLAGIAEWLKQLVVEQIIGALTRLLKENAVNAFDWLCEQADEQIVNGYMRLSDEDKFLLKNQLKEHPRFSELLKKIEEREAN
jgi:hypothetical protein